LFSLIAAESYLKLGEFLFYFNGQKCLKLLYIN